VRMKIGVLYGGGATSEDEMYCNEDGSAEFYEFLDCVADKIELSNFRGYAGGLDVRKGATGSHAYFTKYRGIDMLFHVSTLIPFTQGDLQQVERKRHIGNDIVVLVFREANDDLTVDTELFRSQFNHIFVFVQPTTRPDSLPPTDENEGPFYKVSVAHTDVCRFGPPLPRNSTFSQEDLREWLLVKLLNAECSALYGAKVFRDKLTRVRSEVLEELVNTYSTRARVDRSEAAESSDKSTKNAKGPVADLVHFGTSSQDALARANRDGSLFVSSETIPGARMIKITVPTHQLTIKTAVMLTSKGADLLKAAAKKLPEEADVDRMELSWQVSGLPLTDEELGSSLNELSSQFNENHDRLVLAPTGGSGPGGHEKEILYFFVQNSAMQCKTPVTAGTTVADFGRKMRNRFADSDESWQLFVMGSREEMDSSRTLASYRQEFEEHGYNLWMGKTAPPKRTEPQQQSDTTPKKERRSRAINSARRLSRRVRSKDKVEGNTGGSSGDLPS
jgi:Rap/ran-GAP